MRGIDTLGRLDSDAGLLRLRLETLNRQLATGRRADAPGDLAPALPRAAALRSEAARRDTYGAAIGEALGRAQATQGALGRLSDIAREFGAGVAMKLDAGDPASIPLAAARARAALVEVGQILNTRHAGEHLFGGSDSANPPVPAPDDLPASGFASQIAAAVAGLGGGNAAATRRQRGGNAAATRRPWGPPRAPPRRATPPEPRRSPLSFQAPPAWPSRAGACRRTTARWCLTASRPTATPPPFPAARPPVPGRATSCAAWRASPR